MSWNSISQRAWASILAALSSNKTVRSLSIAWNRLGTTGCRALASMLMQNSTLERLDLTNCGISSAYCETIAESVTHNASLRVLKLDDNTLGYAGTRVIARALQERRIRYSFSEGDSRMIDSSDTCWADAIVATFKEGTPSGKWLLQLSDSRHREVALKLAESARMFEGECWRNERYDGQRFSYHPDWKLPDKGNLEVDFVVVQAGDPDTCGSMEDADFDALCRILQNSRYSSECNFSSHMVCVKTCSRVGWDTAAPCSSR